MHPTPERVIADDESLSVLQKVLAHDRRHGDATARDLHERKDLRPKLEHAPVKVRAAVARGVRHGAGAQPTDPVAWRQPALTYMRIPGWCPSRMPPGMQETILRTDTSIGQLWKAARLETFREIIDFSPRAAIVRSPPVRRRRIAALAYLSDQRRRSAHGAHHREVSGHLFRQSTTRHRGADSP